MSDSPVVAAAPKRVRLGRIPWWSVLLMIVVFYPPILRPFALLGGDPPWAIDYLTTVSEGSRMRQFQLSLLGLAGVGGLALGRRSARGRTIPNGLGWLAAALALLMSASALWSEVPGLTVRRVGAMALVGLAAFAYRRMPRGEFVRLVFYTTMAGLVFGLAKAALKGNLEPWNPEFRFAGTLVHPNMQAWSCALALLSGLALVQGLRRRWMAAVLVLPFAGLILTRSRTSMAALIGAVVFYVFIAVLRRRPLALVASACLALAATVAVVWLEQTAPVVEGVVSLGRQDSALWTLQGRTDVWHEVLAHAKERPWLGYGYDAFWTADRQEDVAVTLGWLTPNAHSNYLEFLLGLGVVGFVLFVGVLAGATVRAARAAIASGDTEDLFFAAMLSFCVLHGFLETTLIGPLFLTFVYLTALARLGFPVRRSGGVGFESATSVP